MKRPQPDLQEALVSDFVSSAGRNRKFKRLWGTTTIAGTEVLNPRIYYHPVGRQPANKDTLFRFLGVTESVEEADNKGLSSAWFYLNKSNGDEDLLVPNSYVTNNLNKAWWDDNDGQRPDDLKLTATISIGAEFDSLKGTSLIDPSTPVDVQAQAVIDNYETLWTNNRITQEGAGVIGKGEVFNDEYKIYEEETDDITPDDPWIDMIARYALRDDGIPCTIKDVEVGIDDNMSHLYNPIVVTLEIPYHEFTDSDPMVQRIINDNNPAQFPRSAASPLERITTPVFRGRVKNNEQATQMGIKSNPFYDDPDDVDPNDKIRNYDLWEDSYTGTSSYQSMWLKDGNHWYLKAEVFTDPRKYGMTHKRLHDYLWPLLDTGYKKKKVPWWKKIVAVVIFVVVAVITFISGGSTSPYLKAAWALVVAAFTLSVIALVASAVGANEWAMAFMEVNKTVEPLVQIASIVLLVNSIATALTDEAAAEGVKQSVGDIVGDMITDAVDNFVKGLSDVLSGKITSDLAIKSLNKLVDAYTMERQNKLDDINSRNRDLKAEYDKLSKELAQETDMLKGFMNIYPKPATADWSIFASLFDLPYERGGGALAMGNIQRTTKQAMRKADYKEAVFENILVV